MQRGEREGGTQEGRKDRKGQDRIGRVIRRNDGGERGEATQKGRKGEAGEKGEASPQHGLRT